MISSNIRSRKLPIGLLLSNARAHWAVDTRFTFENMNCKPINVTAQWATQYQVTFKVSGLQFHLCHDLHKQRKLPSHSESTIFSVVHSRSGTGPNSQRNRHDLLPIRKLAQLDRFQRCETHHRECTCGIHCLLPAPASTRITRLSNRINTGRHNRRPTRNQRQKRT